MASKTLQVVITGDVKDAQKAFHQLDDDADKTSKGIGAKFAQAGKLIAVGIGAGVAGAAVGLFKLGESFDSAYDKIQIGTGATGKELAGLKDQFKEVVQSVPTDFDKASTAITELRQRLGLTGPMLGTTAAQFLELSRITGTDLSGNIQDLTRLYGDWGVKTAQIASVNDMLFRASQLTGVGINQLAQQVVQFGAPLRGLGFGLNESVTMLAKWEKEGVNTELVMGAMKKAFGSFSQEFGAKAPAEFRKFVNEIAKAPDAATAAQLAIEKLGVRNGPDFAAAVQEGRFAYGDLLEQIREGDNTILGAGKKTQDFAEKWQLFKNRVLVRLEPVALAVFNAVGAAMDKLPGIIDKIVAKGRDIVEFFQKHKSLAIGLAVAIGTGLVIAVGAYTASLVAAAAAQVIAFAPFIAIALAIGGVVAALTALGVNWGEVWAWIKQAGADAWAFLKPILEAGLQGALWAVHAAMDAVGFIVNDVWPKVSAAISAAWGIIEPIVSTLLNIYLLPIRTAIQLIGDIAPGVWDTLKTALQTAWAVIEPILSTMYEAIKRVVDVAQKIGSFAKGLVGGSFEDTLTPEQRTYLEGHRAGGGPVWPGSWLVGENGPEILTLGAGATGHVTPNSQIGSAMAGGGVMNVTVNVNGARDPAAVARAVRDELIRIGKRNNSALGAYA